MVAVVFAGGAAAVAAAAAAAWFSVFVKIVPVIRNPPMLKAGCKIEGALSKYNTVTPNSEHALELQS